MILLVGGEIRSNQGRRRGKVLFRWGKTGDFFKILAKQLLISNGEKKEKNVTTRGRLHLLEETAGSGGGERNLLKALSPLGEAFKKGKEATPKKRCPPGSPIHLEGGVLGGKKQFPGARGSPSSGIDLSIKPLEEERRNSKIIGKVTEWHHWRVRGSFR